MRVMEHLVNRNKVTFTKKFESGKFEVKESFMNVLFLSNCVDVI